MRDRREYDRLRYQRLKSDPEWLERRRKKQRVANLARWRANFVPLGRRKKACGRCGKEFEYERSTARFCPPCREAIHHAYVSPLHPSAREPMPLPYVGHPLFEEARRIVRTDDEDALGEVVVALMEGRDGREALRRWRSKEAGWRYATHHVEDIGRVGYDVRGHITLGWQGDEAA